MAFVPSFPRRRWRARSFHLLVFLTLVTMLLTPLADQAAMAQADPQQQEQQDQPAEPTEEPPPTQEPVPTEEVIVTEEPIEETMEPIEETVVPTETPTEEPAAESAQLTIAVYRCNHPEFDPYFSENMQRVLDTCTGPGSGTFTVRTPNGEETQSGGSLTFEIEADLTIEETLQPGYDDPIANCFVYDPTGALVDQIGPGETNGGGWRVGGVGGDVHCDWYQVDRGLGDVYVENMACPNNAGLSPEPSLDELVELCQVPVGPRQFSVRDGAGLTHMGVSGELNDVVFEAIQTGPIEIWMDDPAGFDRARVFCQVHTFEGVESSPFTEVSVSDFRASGMTLAHRQLLYCSWFNILEGAGDALPDDPTAIPDLPEIEPGVGSVAVNIHACPEGVDAYSLDMFEMAAQCQDDPGSVNFTVANANFNYSEGAAASGGGNYASFTDVITGVVTITESVPEGYGAPVVFCKVERDFDLADVMPTQEMTVSAGASISMPLSNGWLIWCDWYNVPASTSPGDTSSDLVIEKHTCPAGYDPEATGANPETDCPEGPDGVTFTLADNEGDNDDLQSATGDSVPNTVVFGDLPGGAYTIVETIPGGTGTIFVLGCGGGGGVDPIPQVIDGTLLLTVQPGMDITCPWFNVPSGEGDPLTLDGSPEAATPTAEGTGSITIAKYECPAGFDVASIDSNPQASCTPVAGVSFGIYDTIDDGNYHSVQTDATGVATRAKLPADTYSILGEAQNGVTATFIWDCYEAGGSSARTDPLSMVSAVTFELADGDAIRCDWFDVVGGSSRVVIATHGCGVTVPAYVLDLAELRAQCTIDTGRIDFSIFSGTHRETLPAANNPLTLASFANVPSGYIWVVEKLPGGWGTPIVSCQVLGADGLPVGDPQFMDLVGEAQIDFALESGQVMGCDWFNVTRGPLEVRMIAYTCPEDFDAYRWADAPVTLASNCTAKPDAVEFTVHDGWKYQEQRTATPDSVATWLDAPSGELMVTERVPEGYGRPLVFCEILITDASNNRYVEQRMVEVGVEATISQNAPAGQLLQCTWFNVKGGTGYVAVRTHACPETIDVPTASRVELQNGCHEPGGTVDYILTSGSFTDTATSTDPFRYVEFPSVPTGDLTVKQTSATDYDTAVAYCYTEGQGGVVTPMERVEVSADRAITWSLDPYLMLNCEWFLGTTPAGTITVTKWDCPEYLPAGMERSAYEAACTQTRDGVDFTVTGVASSSTQTTANGGTAQWTGIQPGLVTIAEHIPEGYGQPVVFCTAPKINSSFPVANGTIEHTLYAGDYLTCDWYNVPLEKGTVVVTKWICPEDAATDRDAAWYASNCTQPHADVEFTLTHSGGSVPGTTNAAGEASFLDLPLGPVGIQEHIPTGYGDPVVFCWYGGETMLSLPERMDAPGGYREAELTSEAKSYTCFWYNIPAGPNTITIHKYTCPAGYDPHASNANPEKECDEPTGGVTFHIGGPATELSDTTGDDGRVTFGDLPDGTVTVTEDVPDGTAASFVWDCTGQRTGEVRPTPLAVGPTLELVLDGGEDIVCRWYNVEDHDPGHGRLTVIKYTCATEEYVSDVDCEIEEDGVTFDLLVWNGDDWEDTDTGTTNGAGRLTFGPLEEGEYWLDELDAGFCRLASEQLSTEGNWLTVDAGEETVVYVYNCGAEPGEQGKVPTTPMKYPNTGVPPAREEWRATP